MRSEQEAETTAAAEATLAAAAGARVARQKQQQQTVILAAAARDRRRLNISSQSTGELLLGDTPEADKRSDKTGSSRTVQSADAAAEVTTVLGGRV